MLDRKSYRQDEIDNGRNAIESMLTARIALLDAINSEDPEGTARSTLADLDPLFFNTLTLALDRYYVYRGRADSGEGASALDELALIVESLMNNAGIFRVGDAAGYVPARAIARLEEGDPIRLTAHQFERLSNAVFAELEAGFLE
ncbi:MAG: hypothetical protein WDM88_01740 [Galbitalea sp.]